MAAAFGATHSAFSTNNVFLGEAVLPTPRRPAAASPTNPTAADSDNPTSDDNKLGTVGRGRDPATC